MPWSVRPLVALAVVAVLWACTATTALALDLVVDTFGDSAAPSFQACTGAADDCALRGAIIKANATPGPHTITLPAGSYSLSVINPSQTINENAAQTGDLDILQEIIINGVSPAQTVITWDATLVADVANRDRIFHVLPSGNLTIRDMSIRLGGQGTGFFFYGGGVYSQGTLTMERVSSRLHFQAFGAGVAVESSGNTVIRNSAINNNNGVSGVGLYAALGGNATVTIENSTLSNNQGGSTGGGGAVYYGPSGTNTTVLLSSSTVATNGNGAAGGLYKLGQGSLVLRNTIVASNTTMSSNPNCFGTIFSQGYNLVYGGDTCGMSVGNGDVIEGNPQLTGLNDYGGPTATHALNSGSAAMDRGNPATPGSGGNACPASDQRGVQRTIDGDGDGAIRCDIGAAEGGRWLAVNSTTDSNDASFRACNPTATPYNCSLRGALTLANGGGVGAAAVITLPATGTGNPYRLTVGGTGDDTNATGDLDVDSDVTIVGSGAFGTIVDGNNVDRVFHVLPGSLRALKLQDLTVQNGNGPSSGVGGGAVYVQNPLSLLRTRIWNNRAGAGGGLYVLSGSARITESTLSENQAVTSGAGGGALYNQGGTTVTLVNTTVANNSGQTGGGLWVYGDAVLANVTMVGNQATNGGGISGNGAMTARNTIIANNTATNSANCSIVTQTSQGFNLVFPGVGVDTCNFVQGSDKRNVDPRLGPLQNNGGTTETMALQSGSAAIDAGSTATPGSGGTACAATDQRGTPRPINGDVVGGAVCDIGAYEAAICTSNRPRVALGVLPGSPGRLSVTVTAGFGNIAELRMHAAPQDNVQVTAGPYVNQAGELIVPVNAPVTTFSIRRANGTGSGTLKFDVVDGCNVWKTLAGGGPNAWPPGSGLGASSDGDGDSGAGQPGTGQPSAPAATVPPACAAERPKVGLATVKTAEGKLQVIISARTSPGVPANALRSLRIGSVVNASVTLDGRPVTPGQVVTLPDGTRQTTLTVERHAADRQGSVGASLVVADACGDWGTFVGSGPGT